MGYGTFPLVYFQTMQLIRLALIARSSVGEMLDYESVVQSYYLGMRCVVGRCLDVYVSMSTDSYNIYGRMSFVFTGFQSSLVNCTLVC